MGGTIKDSDRELVARQIDDMMEFRDSLARETDRGAALICGAYIEDRLREALEQTFVDVPKVMDNLFNHNGPLGTLSAKIDIALAVGIITEESHRGLHLIRKIRNRFAHFRRPCSFEDEDVAAQCRELLRSIVPTFESKSPREMFVNCTSSSVATLNAHIGVGRRIPVLKSRPDKKIGGGIPKFQEKMKEVLESLPPERLARLNDPKTMWEEYRLLMIEAVVID